MGDKHQNSKERILMVTGHRYLAWRPEQAKWVRSILRCYLTGFQRRFGKNLSALSGMAPGADTIFLEEALDLGVKAYAAIPFEGQGKNWPTPAQEQYHRLLDQCAERFFVCDPGYAAWKMFERNHFLVEKADFALAVWDGTEGGTGHTVDLLLGAGLPTIRIDPTTRKVSKL